MKKIVFVLISVFALSLFNSCTKDDTVTETEDLLIEEITTSADKINVEPAELPEAAQQTIEDEYFETYVESCAKVDGKGYEVTMGNEDVAYFRTDGRELRGGDERHGPHRPGPCGRGHMIPIDSLPQNVVDSFDDLYPGEDILRAKKKGGFYLLKIKKEYTLPNGNTVEIPTVLVFKEDGTFVLEAPIFRFCNHFVDRINIDNLPDIITDYISDEYPDGEIKIAWKVRGKVVVGIITPDGRKILVFDNDGNFLFERG